MKSLELPSVFKNSPNRIEGAGVEVILFSSLPGSIDSPIQLHLHTLMIILDGEITITCDSVTESLTRDEAIMMKKSSTVRMDILNGKVNEFRCLLLFFDEPSLKYALMPFELDCNDGASTSVLKIPLNEKLKVFAESILLYYQSNKEKNNWTLLLQAKLRELIWIFFHTNIKDQAKAFFSVSA